MKPRAGFEPATSALPRHVDNVDWSRFHEWLKAQGYADKTVNDRFSYARKYCNLLYDPAKLERFSPSKKDHIQKALITLARYLGVYAAFKQALKTEGIGWNHTSSVDSFLRIMSNKNGDVLEWLDKASEVLDDKDLTTYLRFCGLSGIRKSEAIHSFNLIIELHRSGRLGEYYNRESQTLEHFKYSELFLRNTKNVFISMIPRELVREITECEPVTYETLRKRLYRRDMQVRINELRDYWGTFMLGHGLIKEEVDLLQGRISKSIFVRNYWSPAIQELRDRVFNALGKLKLELA